MGKPEDEVHEEDLPSTTIEAPDTTRGAGNRSWGWIRVQKVVSFRCVLVLVLAFAVVSSAVFWLPFFHFGDHGDLDLDYAGHDIVASFMLREPASFLEDHILELEGDIFDEMSFYSTKVEIISIKSSARQNTTKVVFAVEADEPTRSLIKASFVSLVTQQSFLRLASSLFGTPFSFEVLKFRGGITVSPEQKAFLFLNVQILFNFTLNFSIDEILGNFDKLRRQLKTGLLLSPYENLYIRLTNLQGSSVALPTTVQSQVLLAVGINPSKTRLKQLAQTITGSHTKNLGLNNSIFGHVKQVHLSSILQLSLGGEGNSSSPSPLPLPSSPPLPSHHHHRHRDIRLAPSHPPSPSRRSHEPATGRGSMTSTPAPAPGKSNPAVPPRCHVGSYNQFPRKHDKFSHGAPSSAPFYAPAAAPLQPHYTNSPLPPVPAARPPGVAQAPSHPPPSKGKIHAPTSKGKIQARRPDIISPPAPSPSSAGSFLSAWGQLPSFLLIALLL